MAFFRCIDSSLSACPSSLVAFFSEFLSFSFMFFDFLKDAVFLVASFFAYLCRLNRQNFFLGSRVPPMLSLSLLGTLPAFKEIPPFPPFST